MPIQLAAMKTSRVALLAAGIIGSLVFAHHAALAQGDVFSSQGAGAGGRSSQKTGKGATRDDRVYRQQIGDDCAGPDYGVKRISPAGRTSSNPVLSSPDSSPRRHAR